jgi:hypothetical protein
LHTGIQENTKETIMTQLKGSCLCGAVRYTCDSEPLFTVLCHCAACQKSTGSAFSVVVGAKKQDFRISGDTLATYEGVGDSGHTTYRRFCSRCGSTLCAEMGLWPELVGIKAGTLDDPKNFKPQSHVYWRDHQAWIEELGHLPKNETTRQRGTAPGKS